MSTQTDFSFGRILRRVLSGAGRLVWQLGKRGYALALISLVLWLSWMSLHYLVAALILPARPPAQIVDTPLRLKPSVMMRSQNAAKSMPTISNDRSPLSHYHRLDTGFQPDALNGCTITGCHAPMPHGKNKADRAFLNMHSTSIQCSVCHAQASQKPLPLAWYDLQTGKTRSEAPALLRAYEWLTRPSVRATNAFTASDQTEIVRLLREAADEAYAETDLVSLSKHLAAVRATSDEFSHLVKVARDACQGHFRGEYGAKLALIDPRNSKALLRNQGNEDAVRDFLARRDRLTVDEKKALVEKIHPLRRDPTLHCVECHRIEGGLVDFRSLGYPPARIQAISSPLVTRAIDHIVEGKPFYLPSFLEIKE
jgi:hypothetical protein